MARRLGLAFVGCVLAMSSPAAATTFSFGTIAASDEITAIRLAADSGSGTTITFDSNTNTLVLEASVAQFDFANKAAIAGIPTGDVRFMAQLSLQGSPTFIGGPFPTQLFAAFNNGVVDWTILDVAGGATVILQADFQTNLNLSVIDSFLTVGELTGTYAIIGGDADAQAAFGAAGEINASLNFGTAALCGLLATCPSPTSMINWSANPTMTLTPVVPEPGTAALAFLAVVAAAALRRR